MLKGPTIYFSWNYLSAGIINENVYQLHERTIYLLRVFEEKENDIYGCFSRYRVSTVHSNGFRLFMWNILNMTFCYCPVIFVINCSMNLIRYYFCNKLYKWNSFILFSLPQHVFVQSGEAWDPINRFNSAIF